MDIYSSKPLPKQLKTLASHMKDSRGNTLLHQFVLHNSDPNQSGSASYINAVLLSMADIAVNAVNDEQYTALHLAVLKKNVLMVKKLLSCLRNIDVNKTCGKHEENIALHMAVKLGPLSIVAELLNKGADVNMTNKLGDTALCFAARSNDFDMVNLLLSKGAKINLVNQCTSPLHYAAKFGNLETVKVLLSHGANLYFIDEEKLTVLHIAAQSGHLTTVKFLVNQGANLNAEDKEGNTPITYAANSGHLTVVEFLAYKDPYLKVKNGWRRPLFAAARNGHVDVIKYFLDSVANVDINAVLLNAVTSSNLETLKFLIDIGADVNTKSEDTEDTPLHRAMKESSNFASVEFLVSSGADLKAENKDGKSPLHFAVYGRKDLKMTGFLLEQGADLQATDKDGKTPLHDAVSKYNSDFAEWLINKGADLRAGDIDGKTPLHIAVCRNSLECTELLINNGADLCSRDKNENTPLHDVVCGNNLKCMELLISKGADLHAMNKCGETPLHRAVIYGSAECTVMLIDRGADVNVKDTWNGFTPLHFLLQHNNTRIYDPEWRTKIYFLLKGNADVNIKDKKGETPVYLAMQSNDISFTEWFLSKATNVENVRNGCTRTPFHPAIQNCSPYSTQLFLERTFQMQARYNNDNTELHDACSHPYRLDMIEMFISSGSDLNARNELGETPLHIASNNLGCTILLLEKGANINLADINGWTPLHTAADKGRAHIVRALLKRGADKEAKNNSGKIPLDLAKDNKNQACVDAFQQT